MNKHLLKLLMRTVVAESEGGGGSQTESQETAKEPSEETSEDEQLGENGLKALKSERAANKELRREVAELKKQLETASEANLSELEKTKLAASKALEQIESLKVEKLRSDIALEYKISKEDRDLFMTGTDKDTLAAQAKRLVEHLQPGTPKADATQGTASTPALNSDKLTEALERALGIG